MKISLAGYYRFIVIDSLTGLVKQETSTEKNLITNIGLDRMGSSLSYLGYCQVGSGSAAPAVTDTGLQSMIAVTSNVSNVRGYENVSSPAFGWIRRTYTFEAGTAIGNLSEVSIGWLNGSGGAFSRSLIKDGGIPITLTVSGNDILQVVYELRSYINVNDIQFNCSIAGVNHACIARPCDAGASSYWAFGGNSAESFGSSAFTTMALETDILSPASSFPSGSTSNGSCTNVEYVSGTYYIDFHNDFQLSEGNFQSGIGLIVFRRITGYWQVSFNPKIQKTASKTLRITARIYWGRA